MIDFKRVYIDTSPLIYYLENSSLYMDKIKKFFVMCLENHIQMVTSVITIEEYLVFPYASGNMELIDNFKRFIEYTNIEIVDINSEIAEKAAIIRGQFKYFKAMDSLQIAAAKVSKCDMFFTNDKQLRQETELPCITIDDL
ncbi:MAG: PIN domain-containing protein [Lachnospiraceae bacterium]|jgi:predicted nucleic acid-binding protein|nr:PIN domain-containing protein [Lachnospiraceae bacterium]